MKSSKNAPGAAALLLCLASMAAVCIRAAPIALIPQPAHLATSAGSFELTAKTNIIATEAKAEANLLA